VKKKLLSCALALVMLFGSFMLPAGMPLSDLFGFEVTAAASDFTYKVNSDGETVTITGYTGKGGDVKIPSSIDGKAVTKIGSRAFEYYENIKSVEIPNSVTSIGNNAFYYCLNLKSAKIGNGVTKIGIGAFAVCAKLKSVKIGNSVTSIGDSAFYTCVELTSITIPNSVTRIDPCAFTYCLKLKSVKIGNKVKSIKNSAFGHCLELTSITIPNSVTKIDDDAFVFCEKLKSVNIGKNVKSIGWDAFGYCKSLKAITIPDNVKSMNSGVFSGCTSLKRIVIGKGVNSIGHESRMFAAGSVPVVYTNNSYAKKHFEKYEGATCKPLSKWNVKPKGLKRDKVTSKTATISWKRVPEASGYQILRYDSKTKKYKAVANKKPSLLKHEITKNLKPATKYKYRVKSFVQVNGKKYYSSPSDITIRTRNAPVKISSVTSPKTKTVRVKWQKDGKGDGYNVQIAKDKKFTSGKKSFTIKKNGTVSKTISGLTKDQTYYVRVRAYQTVNGKKFYGDWSVKKSVKCK